MKTDNDAYNYMEVALRVLNAYTGHNLPMTSDEAYLRVLTGDLTTPGDELACRVVQAELQRLRATHPVKARRELS